MPLTTREHSFEIVFSVINYFSGEGGVTMMPHNVPPPAYGQQTRNQTLPDPVSQRSLSNQPLLNHVQQPAVIDEQKI